MKVDAGAIRQLIDESGMTRAKVAKRAGLSEGGLYSVLRTGRCHPYTAHKIAETLGATMDRIMGNGSNERD